MYSEYNTLEEQSQLLIDAFNNIKVITNDFIKLFNQVIQEKIKPIIDRIREFLENKSKPNERITYRPIRIIRPNCTIKINKFIRICCRSNC